jgi:two-component system sensor histidine kinase BarA
MDDVVYKPYTLAQLRTCFQRLLPEWSAETAAAADASAETAAPMADVDAHEQLIDPAVFQELQTINGPAGDAFVRRVLGLYADHAPRARDQIAVAARDGDREACARAAHALKSMSHNIGARPVAARAEAIERCARETGMPEAAEIEALDKLLDATMAEIGGKLAGLGSDAALVARQG